MNSDKISVIVPAYNVEYYLERCIISILRQTHTNFEIVLVNDGSTDHTGNIADTIALSDERIKVIHKNNGGVSSARLTGIKHAAGRWITFVDGDDEIERDMLEKLLHNAIKYKADISHCGYQMVFPDGHVDYYYNSGKRFVSDKKDGLLQLISGSIVEPSLGNKLFRAELFRNLPEIDFSIRHNEDFLLNYYLFSRAQRSVFEDFCPYHYCLRAGSATTSAVNQSRLEDPIRVTRTIQQASDSSPELDAAIQARLVRQLITGTTMSPKESPELIRPHRAKCRKELREEITKGLDFRSILTLQAYWAAFSPRTYATFHFLYTYLTGKQDLYSIQ